MTSDQFNQYKLDITEIDDHHWSMFQLMNDIQESSSKNDTAAVIQSLEQLMQELIAHSDEGIKLMRSLGFPYLSTHEMSHVLLIYELRRAIERAKLGDLSFLAANVERVVVDHIVHYDKLYAEYYRIMS